MDRCPNEQPGKKLMQKLLRNYFFWKGGLGKIQSNLSKDGSQTDSGTMKKKPTGAAEQGDGIISDALKRKGAYQRGQQPLNKRRRQRGGASGNAGVHLHNNASTVQDGAPVEEASSINRL